MEMNTAVAPAKSAFENIGSGVANRTPDRLDPNATRYGFAGLWDVGSLSTTAFQRETLPGCKIFAFRPFEFAAPKETDSKDFVSTAVRTAADQAIELFEVAAGKFPTDFPELALLRDDEAANLIATALINPNTCTKYPLNLGNTCATCWLDYLQDGAIGAITALPAEYHAAAIATAKKLQHSLFQGLDKARRDVNEAKQHVDDPKKGKDSFVDVDYHNIRHTHQDMPEYRTITGSQSVGKEIAEALKGLNLGQPVGLSVDDVKSIVAESVAKAVADKQDEIEQLRKELETKPKSK